MPRRRRNEQAAWHRREFERFQALGRERYQEELARDIDAARLAVQTITTAGQAPGVQIVYNDWVVGRDVFLGPGITPLHEARIQERPMEPIVAENTPPANQPAPPPQAPIKSWNTIHGFRVKNGVYMNGSHEQFLSILEKELKKIKFDKEKRVIPPGVPLGNYSGLTLAWRNGTNISAIYVYFGGESYSYYDSRRESDYILDDAAALVCAHEICDFLSPGRAVDAAMEYDERVKTPKIPPLKLDKLIPWFSDLFQDSGGVEIQNQRQTILGFTNSINQVKRTSAQQARNYSTHKKSLTSVLAAIKALEREGRFIPTDLTQIAESYRVNSNAYKASIKTYERDIQSYIKRQKEAQAKLDKLLQDLRDKSAGIKDAIAQSHKRIGGAIKSGIIETVQIVDHNLVVTFPPFVLEIKQNKKCPEEARYGTDCQCTREEFSGKFYMGRVQAKIHKKGSCGTNIEYCGGLQFHGLSYEMTGFNRTQDDGTRRDNNGNYIRERWCHPHVNTSKCHGGICKGSYNELFLDSISKMDLFGYIMQIKMFLTNVNPHSFLVYPSSMRNLRIKK